MGDSIGDYLLLSIVFWPAGAQEQEKWLVGTSESSRAVLVGPDEVTSKCGTKGGGSEWYLGLPVGVVLDGIM